MFLMDVKAEKTRDPYTGSSPMQIGETDGFSIDEETSFAARELSLDDVHNNETHAMSMLFPRIRLPISSGAQRSLVIFPILDLPKVLRSHSVNQSTSAVEIVTGRRRLPVEGLRMQKL